MSRLFYNDVVQGNGARQGFINVASVHADQLFAAAEREASILAEAAIACEAPSLHELHPTSRQGASQDYFGSIGAIFPRARST